jgi:hypothetical protein
MHQRPTHAIRPCTSHWKMTTIRKRSSRWCPALFSRLGSGVVGAGGGAWTGHQHNDEGIGNPLRAGLAGRTGQPVAPAKPGGGALLLLQCNSQHDPQKHGHQLSRVDRGGAGERSSYLVRRPSEEHHAQRVWLLQTAHGSGRLCHRVHHLPLRVAPARVPPQIQANSKANSHGTCSREAKRRSCAASIVRSADWGQAFGRESNSAI